MNPVSPYRVQLIPRPIVIGASGAPVANSHVVELRFSGEIIETVLGPVNMLVGPGFADIMVDETTIADVPLC